MPFAIIRISKGSRTLHGWYIHPIPYDMTLKDFFVKLVAKELSPDCNIAVTTSEVIERAELSETPVSVATQVSLDCSIMELSASIGVHIHYRLKNDIDVIPEFVPQRNSFTIMMQNAYRTQLYLPAFSQPGKPNRKQILRADLVDWIRLHNGGWSTQSLANTQGKQFIVSLAETIWYIDMCNHEKFEERSYHIPELFHEFFARANPESYKQSRRSFDANELNLHCQALAPYITSSWMLMKNFDWLRDEFDNFIVAISNYVGYLQHHRVIAVANHTSENPVRAIDRATTVKVHNKNVWVTPIDKTKYDNLRSLLTSLPSWKPIDIEEYLPNGSV
jgi:hypothetical protein